MITGYQDFYYNVLDLERAAAFYSQALGMTKAVGTQVWTAMTVGNLILGLHRAERGEVPLTPRDQHGQDCGGTLTLASNDIRADRQRIELAGGKILGEFDLPWGHFLVFEDLDHNILRLMKPKDDR